MKTCTEVKAELFDRLNDKTPLTEQWLNDNCHVLGSAQHWYFAERTVFVYMAGGPFPKLRTVIGSGMPYAQSLLIESVGAFRCLCKALNIKLIEERGHP